MLVTQLSIFLPGSKPASSESHKYWADQFSKRCCIDWLQFLLLTMQEVMAVQGTARKAHTLSSLIVIQQPLDLQSNRSAIHRSFKLPPKPLTFPASTLTTAPPISALSAALHSYTLNSTTLANSDLPNTFSQYSFSFSWNFYYFYFDLLSTHFQNKLFISIKIACILPACTTLNCSLLFLSMF